MDFTMLFTAAGGLGLFFLGLRFLSDSLQQIAGDLIRKLINKATSNRFTAVIVGLVVTCIVQSSSISTVMVVGLVNAGLMQLTQAIGVILGANIGTTITGWILVVKVGKYGLLFIALGFFPMLFSKIAKRAASGKMLVALGLIFIGLQNMSGAFKPLRKDSDFINYLAYFDATSLTSIIGCVIIGCLLTFIIQSSSAMLGITIAMATTGSISYPTAAALVLGENIGTTITALLASIGTNTTAKRAATSHAVFNTLGVAIMIALFPTYISFIDSIVPGDPETIKNLADGDIIKEHIAAHIAMGHSIFNVTATILMLPFINYLARFVTWMIPEPDEKRIQTFEYIDIPGGTPAGVGLQMAELELKKLSNIVNEVIVLSEQYVHAEVDDDQLFKRISKLEKITDKIQTEITTFVCRAMEGRLSDEQSNIAYSIIRKSDELESIADYAESVATYRKQLFDSNLNFSEEGWKDVFRYFTETKQFFEKVTENILDLDEKKIDGFWEKARELNDQADSVRDRHLERMREGTCKALPALSFSDIIVSLRRIKNHTVNLFEAG